MIRNIAKCKLCGDVIESKHRRDFVWCSCNSIYLDGGTECPRGGGNPDNFAPIEESIIHVKDDVKTGGGENMNKKDIIRKITSRKFLSMVVAFITAVLVFFNYPESDIKSITALIGMFGTLVAYIFTEGMVDAERVRIEEDDEI